MTTTPYDAAKRLAEMYGVEHRNGDSPTPKKRFEPATEAKALLEDGLHVAKGGGALHVYNRDAGSYERAEGKLRHMLTERLGERWSPDRANAIITWLYDTASTLWERPPLDELNVLNGILDLGTLELREHSPDFLSPVQVNAEWDADATCPLVRQFLSEVFPEDVARLAYEIAGCLLVPDNRLQQAFLYQIDMITPL